MPNAKINWVNDYTEISDRFNQRVSLMENYLNGKPTEKGT